jgi:hypothetical protein
VAPKAALIGSDGSGKTGMAVSRDDESLLEPDVARLAEMNPVA